MAKGTIRVSTDPTFFCDRKEMDVEAELFGPLAVHRTTDALRLWTVTHIATGFAVKSGIHTKAKATKLARDLIQIDCWDFGSPKDVANIPHDSLTKVHALRNAV